MHPSPTRESTTGASVQSSPPVAAFAQISQSRHPQSHQPLDARQEVNALDMAVHQGLSMVGAPRAAAGVCRSGEEGTRGQSKSAERMSPLPLRLSLAGVIAAVSFAA